MAAPDLRSLARQIAADSLLLITPGFITPIVMMIRHEPGSNVFCLAWEPGKLYIGMIAASFLLSLIAIGRWQKWRDLQ